MKFYANYGQYDPNIHTFEGLEEGLKMIINLATDKMSNSDLKDLKGVAEILTTFQLYVEVNDPESAKRLKGRISEVRESLEDGILSTTLLHDRVGVEALDPVGEEEGGIAVSPEAHRDIPIHHLGGVKHQSVSAHWGKQMYLGGGPDRLDSGYFWERISIKVGDKECHLYKRWAKRFYDQWVAQGAEGDFQTFIQKAFVQTQSHPETRIPAKFLTCYLSPAELSKTKVTFREDGKLCAMGLLALEVAEPTPMHGRLIAFVIGGDDEMYAAPKGEIKDRRGETQYVISHSSFMRGGGVRTAGMMEVNNGKIAKLYFLSGHYKTSLKEIVSLLQYLWEKLGIESFRELNIEMLGVVRFIFKNELKDKSFKAGLLNLLYIKYPKTQYQAGYVKDPVAMLEWLEECLVAKAEGKAAPRPYLGPSELAKTKVMFGVDDLLSTVGLLAPDGAEPKLINEKGWVAFVIGEDGEMYAAPMRKIKDEQGIRCTIDQSSFIRGDDVKGAGLMRIQKGDIYELQVITAEGSDYCKPELEKAINLLKFFMGKFGEEEYQKMSIEILRQLNIIFAEEIKEKPFEDAMRNLFDINSDGRGYAKDPVQLLRWLEECQAARAEGGILPIAPEVI